jgi:hypothetical protein
MSESKSYLNLQPSETAVVHAASRIFAGYLRAGGVGENNENAMIEKAVDTAILMAALAEKKITSDDELASGESRPGKSKLQSKTTVVQPPAL